MRRLLHFSAAECTPAEKSVLGVKGISGPGPAAAETLRLVAEARELFGRLAAPAGVYADVTQQEFGTVFTGEGRNAPDAVLAGIYPWARGLALFACTVGAALTEEVRKRFERHDYALGYVLDATASAGAERLAGLVQSAFSSELGNLSSDFIVRYSPGYCGWHVSGQRKLFEFLRPEEIGITLRESFLMEPLKSVSGVFVSGPGKIHRFSPASFAYCADCRNRTCGERIAALEVD